MEILGNLSGRLNYKYAAVILLIMNIIAIAYGILYLVVPHEVYASNACGAAILATFLGNILMVHFSKTYHKKDNTKISTIFVLGIAYLTIASLAILGMYLGNLFISVSYSGSPLGQLAVFGSYFTNFILGGVYNCSLIKLAHQYEEKQYIKSFTFFGFFIKVFSVAGFLLLALGVAIAVKNTARYQLRSFEVFLPGYELFNAFFFLCWSVILLQLLNGRSQPVVYSGVLALGVAMFSVYMLPLLSTPKAIKSSEKAFVEAFGDEAEGKPVHMDERFFLKRPFSLPAYFLGIPCRGSIIKKDILFYQGDQGVDKGIELYFDAYMPVVSHEKLPGKNTGIIRLHGGAWTAGDKGPSNMLQMNRYLASQGYSVFDIQYGLSERGKYDVHAGVPPNIKGDFTVDDMVRHVGKFLQYLSLHKEEYQVNLGSVFIAGSSAGGNLASGVALSIGNSQYKSIIPPNMKLKGLILFYPANQLPLNAGVIGSNSLVNPEFMVNKDSPPCIIFQGIHDGLVDPEITKSFQENYFSKGNRKCAVLWMPFAGHASDFNFSGYYNQIFLYYMERFIYTYR